MLLQISAITGFSNFHRQQKNQVINKSMNGQYDGTRYPVGNHRLKNKQFIRKYSGHEKLRQRKVHDKLNEAVSYNPSHLNRRRQYGSPPINYYQNYVSTVRQYFKQQNPKHVKPSFKRLPNRKNPRGGGNRNYRPVLPFMPIGINRMMSRISSGWNDFANSIMNKWFSFYYTYYEDRKRSGISSDPIDNEYDSSESISVIPSKHFYYT